MVRTFLKCIIQLENSNATAFQIQSAPQHSFKMKYFYHVLILIKHERQGAWYWKKNLSRDESPHFIMLDWVTIFKKYQNFIYLLKEYIIYAVFLQWIHKSFVVWQKLWANIRFSKINPVNVLGYSLYPIVHSNGLWPLRENFQKSKSKFFLMFSRLKTIVFDYDGLWFLQNF